MKRALAAILALSLAACATDKPKPVTAKQQIQANVMATPPTPLQKLAASEEHASEWPVWFFGLLFPSGSVAEFDLPANVVVKLLPFNHPAVVSTGAVEIAKK